MKFVLEDGTEIQSDDTYISIYSPYTKTTIEFNAKDNTNISGRRRVKQLRDALTFILEAKNETWRSNSGVLF